MLQETETELKEKELKEEGEREGEREGEGEPEEGEGEEQLREKEEEEKQLQEREGEEEEKQEQSEESEEPIEKPPFYIDDEDERYKQIKILVNFCKDNIKQIEFENDSEELFLKYLDLFNTNINRNNYQNGGFNLKNFYKMLTTNPFSYKSKNENIYDAIDSMSKIIGNKKNSEMENNIVYNFANSIGFKENNTSNLFINYDKYNKFIKDYKFFNYEEYTKKITINFNKNMFGFLKDDKIFSSLKEIIKKYNRVRFDIFNKYIILKKNKDEDNKEEPPEQPPEQPPQETYNETHNNNSIKEYTLYFSNKFKKDNDFPNINNINDYINNLEEYFKNEIKKIIKLLKEYILKNEELISFDGEQQDLLQYEKEKNKEKNEKELIGGKKHIKHIKYKKSRNQKYKKHKYKITIKKNKNKRSRKK